MLDSIDQIIKTKAYPSILLLFGEEDFLVEEAFRALIASAAPTDDNKFDFDALDGEATNIEAVVSMASAFPFLGERRIVAVKNFESLFSGRSSKKEQPSPTISKFFTTPPKTTLLILQANVKELNGLRGKLNNSKQREQANKIIASLKFPFKNLIESGDWIEFPKISERDMAAWTANRLSERGKEIMPEAAEFIVAKAGASLRNIDNEIEKLVIFTRDKRQITPSDAANTVGASKTYNIFELQKAVGERNMRRSLAIVTNMLDAERQEMLIITMLTRYFLILFKLVETSRVTKNNFTLAQSTGVSAFFIPEYLAALQRYAPSEIENAIFALAAADKSLKTTRQPPLLTLQKMLMEIIAKP